MDVRELGTQLRLTGNRGEREGEEGGWEGGREGGKEGRSCHTGGGPGERVDGRDRKQLMAMLVPEVVYSWRVHGRSQPNPEEGFGETIWQAGTP